NVSPGTRYTATVTAASSSNVSPGVSRMIVTYKEVCPYPDPSFTEVHKYIDIPETLITDFTSGSAYHIEPGLVTNLTAYAYNHTFVVVKWYLPHRINGLITKFGVRAKHARTGKIVRMLEVNAEDIMNGVLPHCNDAADILSQATTSPLEMTASAPSITLSAVPPSAAWRVPISVGVDQLQSFTAYLFEVSGFTSDGEGQIASTMVRMPESAPTEPPQSLTANVTSRRISVVWSSPITITGKYSYVLGLYGPTFLYENSTSDTRFVFTGLTPYTKYKVVVSAKAAGELGPEAEDVVITPPEPSAVQNLKAEAEDSISIRVSWRIPAEPNGPITQYRLQVLVDEILVQDITLTVEEELSYVVSDLNPFTEYTFKVTASTTVGEGPAINITEKTREQPSSVLKVSYENITSTSILVYWDPPLNPNGQITHYTIYGLNLQSNQDVKWVTNTLDKYSAYKLGVAASTVVGESVLSEEDYIFVFTLEDPDSPPENLTVEDTTPSTVTLTWSKPEKANGVIQYYEVLLNNASFTAAMNTTSNRVTLTSLKPFSYYNVSVRAYTRYGHGNQTSNTLYLLSGEDPGSPPYGLSYESITPGEVNVTWQPPLLPNGIITHYSLELRNSTNYLNLTSPTNFLHITHLRKYTKYQVVVQAHTHAGPGNYSSEPLNITTLEDPDTPPQFLHARKLSDYEVQLSWEPPLEANSEILYYIVKINETTQLWQNVTGTSVVIQVDSESRYNASVSSWTKLGDGGVLIYISFTVTDAPFDPPQNVTFENVTASSITLMWLPPTQPNGIIVHYTIYYSDNGTVRKQYTFWMTSNTSQGDGGVQSKEFTLLLPEDPNGPVSNLTYQIFSSTAVIVSWDPPTEPNGRPYYLLTLQEAGIFPNMTNQGTAAVNKTIKQTTTDNVYLFTKLRKYFPYVLTVTPATGAGPAYNHTTTMHLRTDDDPSSPPVLLSTKNLTSSSIQVVWQRPLEANGEITDYTLILSGPGGPNTTQTLNTSVIFTNLIPYTAYNLTIISATRKGVGPPLLLQLHTDEGPMSPPRNLTIFNHTAVSVWLSWEPPLEPNGVVIKYGFRIRDLVTDTNTSGSSTMKYLSGFRPYSSYEISVCSFTRVGHGNQFSLPVTFTTNESSDVVGNLSCSGLTWDTIQLSWEIPENPNGQLLFYNIIVQGDMETFTLQATFPQYTLSGLSPNQEYTLSVAAVNSAGPGDQANCTTSTLSESPDAPPRDLVVTSTSTSLHITWEEPAVLSGPTSYLVQVDGPSVNISIVRSQKEVKTVVVTNLTAFTRYNVTLTAFTGSLEHAKRDGKAIGPITHQTLEAPNDPPKNVNVTAIPEEVKSVTVSFSPPEEPNGIITDYVALVYEKEKLIKNISLRIIQTENNTLTADVEGLKGGHNYSIQPSKPTQTPQAMLGNGGVAMVTHKTITVRKPACFYSDDNGPIAKIQVIVAESGVRDQENITNWRSAFYHRPAPYLTDEGFYNPPCSSVKKTAAVNTHFRGGQPESGDGSSLVRFNQTTEEGYVIGGNNACLEQNNTDHFCNGPLKPNTVYFKFRATNIRGQYTDSDYSEHVRTDGLLTREEQIILGVLLSFFLALFFIIIICVSVLHQHKKEGGTYSPREAEIIETKCKLDQLIAVADMELKQEKLNYRKSLPVNKKSFLQHVEDLCANDNSKFQEEFAELPKLLQDLATTDADLPWNKSKNRFPNIKPNNNRVKLLSEPGTAGSDFINASFVSGYLCPNEFIATQGPLPGTVADFWRMIWETGTRSIAMLTQCYEKGRIRCHKYWPEDNKPMTVFSDILISKVSEEAFPDWTIRTLKVEKHGHYILVKHFNYTSWPEHGVPESCSTFIKFVKAIRAHRHDNSTIAVHCAGVGRTGVFIALDHLIQHVRDHDFVDIYGLVAELRSERMCMVQNLAQYIFLHQCTLELLNNKGNSQSIWFVSYSALEKMDSLDNMEDVELEWEETTM
uniref:Protein tyrosine phosphatase receptor type Q n=1 Tax=Oryzias latipes TaxID=8090 RepID=A0A3P9K2Y6_ORYLA